MASIWYRTGTITLTQGSAIVTGTGTTFAASVRAGDMLIGPVMDMYEITDVISDGQIRIDREYEGASYTGTDWSVAPTAAQLKQLAKQITDLISIYQDIPEAAQQVAAGVQNAQAAASAAAISADNAQASATSANLWKGEAAASATNAAASATTATTGAATATTKASEAAASATTAGTSKDTAVTAAATATTKATEAAASEAGGAANAATATTKAGEAAASAADALASKNAAAGSAATASTKASEAAGSATTASNAATTATAKAGEAAASASSALTYRNETQGIADRIEAGAVLSVAGRTGDVTLTKNDVGLPNVSNTAPADLPISTATQTALSGKEPTIAAGTTAQYWRGDKSWQALNKSAVGLPNVDNTTDAAKPVSTATQAALNSKMNVSGGSFGGGIVAPYVASSGSIDAATNVSSASSGNAFVATGYATSGSINFNNFLTVRPTYDFVMSAQHSPGQYAQIEFQLGNVSRFQFDSGGQGRATSGWTTFSDRSLKTSLEVIAEALAKVRQLTGYTYLRTDVGEEFGAAERRHAGLIAQDVQAVLPEAVAENPGDGLLTLNYDAVVPLLVNAVKELTTRVEVLEAA